MIEIKPNQTTITKEAKLHATQELRKIIDTYPKQINRLKQEAREMEQTRDDALETLKEINKMEVV